MNIWKGIKFIIYKVWCEVLCLFTSKIIIRTDFFLICFHPYIYFPPFSSLIQTIKIAFFLTLNMTSHFTLLYWIACLIVFSMILILSGLLYTVSRWSLYPVLQIVKIHWLGNSVVYILPLCVMWAVQQMDWKSKRTETEILHQSQKVHLAWLSAL